MLRAMCATIDGAIRLQAVPDHPAAAMGAGGRKGMDGALEAIEDVALPTHDHLERFVVLVVTHFTLRHLQPPVIQHAPRRQAIHVSQQPGPILDGSNYDAMRTCVLHRLPECITLRFPQAELLRHRLITRPPRRQPVGV